MEEAELGVGIVVCVPRLPKESETEIINHKPSPWIGKSFDFENQEKSDSFDLQNF